MIANLPPYASYKPSGVGWLGEVPAAYLGGEKTFRTSSIQTELRRATNACVETYKGLP